MSDMSLNFDEKTVLETAAKYKAAANKLPENFDKVIQTFDKYASKSNSNALLNRHLEVKQLQEKKILPACEAMAKIAARMEEEVELLKNTDV